MNVVMDVKQFTLMEVVIGVLKIMIGVVFNLHVNQITMLLAGLRH